MRGFVDSFSNTVSCSFLTSFLRTIVVLFLIIFILTSLLNFSLIIIYQWQILNILPEQSIASIYYSDSFVSLMQEILNTDYVNIKTYNRKYMPWSLSNYWSMIFACIFKNFLFFYLRRWITYNFLMPTEIKYIFNPIQSFFIPFITKSLGSPNLLFRFYVNTLN